MKTIIKGKFYDTDTAITIGKFGEEELFRKNGRILQAWHKNWHNASYKRGSKNMGKELFKRRYIHLIILRNEGTNNGKW